MVELDYQIIFKVYREYILSLFLLNRRDEAEALIKSILNKAQTALDKVSIYKIQIKNHTVSLQFDKTFEVATTALKLLGVKLNTRPSRIRVLFEIFRVRMMLKRFNIENLDKELPKLEDPAILAAVEILDELNYPAYFTSSLLFSDVVCTAIKLHIRYGKSKDLSHFIYCYGLIQLALFRNIDFGIQCHKVAEKLLEELPDKYIATMLYNGAPGVMLHLRRSIKECESMNEKGLQYAAESGNIFVLQNGVTMGKGLRIGKGTITFRKSSCS